jgi:predicted membrane-bound dolichyl-phosphate-mannose-protein mannosyltransferase
MTFSSIRPELWRVPSSVFGKAQRLLAAGLAARQASGFVQSLGTARFMRSLPRIAPFGGISVAV